MVTAPDRSVMRWLCAFCCVVVFLILFGGFVRLTRSGLSIVEWEPVTGVVPPVGHQEWQEAFAEYQESPEFIKVNASMTLEEFRRIFLIEWLHRLVARLAGFSFLIPLAYFVARKRIPARDLPVYAAMGSLFLLQALAGWLMVASGLQDRPSVDHLNLTVHLLLAFLLLSLALWTALDHRFGSCRLRSPARWSRPSRAAATLVALLVAQITYGGFTAGLKAGYVSNTWPRMFGELVPSALVVSLTDLIDSPVTVVFIHRWPAFAVLAASLALVTVVDHRHADPTIRRGLSTLIVVVIAQILLGIATVLTSISVPLALAHQGGATVLFGICIVLLHRLRSADEERPRQRSDETGTRPEVSREIVGSSAS